MIRDILTKISERVDLEEREAMDVMLAVMDGQWTSAQIASLLMGLKMKGETIDEITGFVKAMRQKATKISGPDKLIDTCGTGGDGVGTFNISTAAAIVAAAAGIPVAKHGNKSVSSKCGSADVLQELGVKIDLKPDQAESCLQNVGITFLFAPFYHASMKYAAEPRRDMGIRTVFNILGPMSNPAGVKRQVIGTFNLDVAEKMAYVLAKTGSEHVLVVHSEDGLDEISLSASTHVHELKDGNVRYRKISPEEMGMQMSTIGAIKGDDPAANKTILTKLLDGGSGPYCDITALNAGASIYVGGQAASIREGVTMASELIASGQAKKKLEELINYTNSFTAN